MSNDLGSLIRDAVEHHTSEASAPRGLAASATARARRVRGLQSAGAVVSVLAVATVALVVVVPLLQPSGTPVLGLPQATAAATPTPERTSFRVPAGATPGSVITVTVPGNDTDPWETPRRFLEFAAAPSAGTLAALDVAPTVEFGVDGRKVTERSAADLLDHHAWDVGNTRTTSGQFVGPFNALTAVQGIQHRGGGFSNSHGDVVRCGTTEHIPHAATLGAATRVSVQPDPSAISSCVDWFSVDLYLDDQGRLVGVYYVAGTA